MADPSSKLTSQDRQRMLGKRPYSSDLPRSLQDLTKLPDHHYSLDRGRTHSPPAQFLDVPESSNKSRRRRRSADLSGSSTPNGGRVGRSHSASKDNNLNKADKPSQGQHKLNISHRTDSDDKDVSKSVSSVTDTYEQNCWDIARLVPREPISSSESFQGLLKVLRALVYLLLLLGVWLFCTLSTGTILMLVAALAKEKDDYGNDYRHVARNQLVWILCVPHLCVFVVALFRYLFGNHSWPSFKLFIVKFLLIELPHTFGLTLLVFQVLPNFGSFYGLGLMNSVCLIPAILKVFFEDINSPNSAMKRILWKVLDVLVLVVTVSAVALPFIVKYIDFGKFWWSSHPGVAKNFPLYESNMLWEIPVCLLLVSVKWWENFVGKNRSLLKLWTLKKRIRNHRNNLTVLTSLLNIGIVIGGVHLSEWLDGNTNLSDTLNPQIDVNQNNSEFCSINRTTIIQILDDPASNGSDILLQISNHTSKYCDVTISQYLQSYTPVIVNVCSSLLAYYCSSLACKLLMQSFSFAFPVMMATPTIATIIILQCKDIIPEIPILAGLQFEFRCDLGFHSNDLYVVGGIVAWISILFLTRHVWSPNVERLSHLERIFVTPMYTGPLLCQCLLMNRRNDNMDIKLTGVKKDPELDHLHRQINGEAIAQNKLNEDKLKEEQQKIPTTNKPVAKVYACATMWHETSKEMLQLLKSIYRMDEDQAARYLAGKYLDIVDPDYYEFEAHILFDDAMELDDDDKWVVNSFVIKFKESMREAASAVTKIDNEVPSPTRTATPYGGRLTWKLPGGNNLVVHLKDKNKIRHRKRWSQVMYMYFLLGYKLFDEVPEDVEKRIKSSNQASTNVASWADQIQASAGPTEHFMKSAIFKDMEESLIQKAENTFILALDGDVDFKPNAVTLLLDRMRINPKTGAACGRIHPIGSSPIVWYQKFEYSVGHWFQKSTEHVLGCVLCSPGCFSLFRGSALLDDNVMKRYTTEPTEPVHYLQYDQGEDRWLCTLLLQQGYRVDYTAASDALTYAPETFDEFFNQRRRWTPSTMANIIDLLGDSKNTVLANPNISFLYMVYQFLLMVATVLGPSTIVMAIAAALLTVFEVTLLESYIISFAPVVVYIIICMYMKSKHQLLVGALLSVIYAAIMMVVLVGIIQTIVLDSIVNPSLLFLVAVSVCFVFAGLIHPYEFTTLIHGILYFLCIPAGYLVLMIYSICNLHVVSWGTREVPKRKSKAQQAMEQAKQKTEEKKKNKGLFSFLRLDMFIESLKDMLTQIFNKNNKEHNEVEYRKEVKKALTSVRRDMKKLVKIMSNPNQPVINIESDTDTEEDLTKSAEQNKESVIEQLENEKSNISEKQEEFIDPSLELDDPENPNWIKDKRLGYGEEKPLSKQENLFWQDLIDKYLYPLKKDAAKEKRMAADMISLRNNASFGYWFVNFLWVLFNFMIQRNSHLNTVTIGNLTTEPMGFVFLIFFLTVLLLQMIGMIIHRWSTFLQLISITEITNPWRKRANHFVKEEAIKLARSLGTGDADLSDEDDIYCDINENQNTAGELSTNNQNRKEQKYDIREVKRRLENRKKSPYAQKSRSDHVVDIHPPADYDDWPVDGVRGTIRNRFHRERIGNNLRKNLERKISRQHSHYHHRQHEYRENYNPNMRHDANYSRHRYQLQEPEMEFRMRQRLHHIMKNNRKYPV